MNIKTLLLLLVTHSGVAFIGFAAGIYALPILIAPQAPTESEVMEISNQAQFSAEFVKDLKDSDRLHWGEGIVSISQDKVAFMGELAPGPDYKLYFSPKFVETEADFNALKSQMVRVGEVKTFENFSVDLPNHVNPADYTSVIVWCETFGEFITAAQYR
jgi:hypothetical protein